jgi:hypothetical protein
MLLFLKDSYRMRRDSGAVWPEPGALISFLTDYQSLIDHSSGLAPDQAILALRRLNAPRRPAGIIRLSITISALRSCSVSRSFSRCSCS